jgi:hypothetical protein
MSFLYILFKTHFLIILTTLVFDMFYFCVKIYCVKIHCVKIHIFICLCIIYVKKRTDFLSLRNKLQYI